MLSREEFEELTASRQTYIAINLCVGNVRFPWCVQDRDSKTTTSLQRPGCSAINCADLEQVT